MNDEKYDIAMHPALVPAFEEWLESRGLYLAGPVKSTIGEHDVGEDASFYFIGIKPYLMNILSQS